MREVKLPLVQYELLSLAGGVDQVTPTLSLSPGVIRRGRNFECSVNGGYSRIAGCEKFDGRPFPELARYNTLTCTFTGIVSPGDTITGTTSSATGVVIAVTDTMIAITKQSGTFSPGESLQVSAVTVATLTGVFGVVADGETDATYKYLAAAEYMNDIDPVPGEGNILGVAVYDDKVYAWRNKTGGTTAGMYESSAAGWVEVTFGEELEFDTGTVEIEVGDTVTGETSGATGVVATVVVQSGGWSNSDAAGRLILSSSTGTFQDGENLQVSAATRAVAGGAATQITLLPGGRYEGIVANFGGGQFNKKLYVYDKVNRAFEFDGTTMVPISTGMSPDVPTKLRPHKDHLFLAFGHSLQFSSIGDPYRYSVILGAGEIAMNDIITNLIPLPGDQSGGALAVYTASDTSVLYGSSSADFALATFNVGVGAREYSSQNMEQTYVLSDLGITALGTTLNFGNFAASSLTMNLRPFIEQRLNIVTASTVNREKGQYRVFFSDGSGVYLTVVNGKAKGAIPVQYPFPVLCTASGRLSDGFEYTFFGSDDGYVHRMDAGSSFSGREIAATFSLIYNSVKSPRTIKRFRKASVELTGDSFATFNFSYDLGYRSKDIEQGLETGHTNDLRSAFWDEFTWDNFIWDGNDLTPNEVYIDGTAENIAIRISSVSSIVKTFTINSIILHYSPRRGIR